jgi:hypothetical protein
MTGPGGGGRRDADTPVAAPLQFPLNNGYMHGRYR